MSRTSANIYGKGGLLHGYDYEKQAWVVNGRYVRCGHPEAMRCGCYGRAYEGLTANEIETAELLAEIEL